MSRGLITMSFNTCSSCEEQLHFLLRSVVIHRFNTCSSCEEQLSSPIRSSCNWGFNTCSSCEEQQVRVCHVQNRRFLFQYMLLLRGATARNQTNNAGRQVSIHAPLARSNPPRLSRGLITMSFNTCSSCEEQQSWSNSPCSLYPFQYMLLLRGATSVMQLPIPRTSFNTCSSCEEQLSLTAWGVRLISFNTCSSCEEQLYYPVYPVLFHQFQYMLLLRGATRSRKRTTKKPSFQYMLLLRGATCDSPAMPRHQTAVSIHAPLARSNKAKREAKKREKEVSIHAPLARSNHAVLLLPSTATCFNTCSSCEEQLFSNFQRRAQTGFNTCSSCEEQPHARVAKIHIKSFNTCSSCEEQLPGCGCRSFRMRFQYMLLLRGATFTKTGKIACHAFQYMLLLRGATKRI